MATANYAKGNPVGNNGVPFLNNGTPPPVKAIARYVNENNAASSVITLSQDTTAIEIATTAEAIMRWVPTTDTTASVVGVAGATANYDHVIPANTFRRFVVPIEVNNSQGYSSMVGANIENGLFRRVAVKGGSLVVTGSVLTAEYGSSNSY